MCQKLQALHSYKRTVKVYYYHATTASMGMDPWTGWGLFQILPTFYLYIFSTAQSFSGYLSAALNGERANADSCAIPCLLLSLYQVTCLETNWKHISKAMYYILAELKNSSTGLLADRQAKGNILQAS